MGTIEEEILARVFEELAHSDKLTPEALVAVRETFSTQAAPKAEKLIAAITMVENSTSLDNRATS
jgi:hypothetical protein